MKIIACCAILTLLLLCCPSATEPAAPVQAPAGTPTPSIMTYRDIELKKKELTDLQWEAYAKGLIGEPIQFSGKVIEVYEDGRVQVMEGKGLINVCILYGLSLDVAASLAKDQQVQGQGMVRGVDTILGLRVEIDVEKLEK